MKHPVPTLLLDEKIARANIQKMVNKANSRGISLRPHFKTHQAWEIGNWFRDEGIDKITVSSLKMAEYFATDGWRDITLAFPVNILAIDRINQLAKNIQLNLVVESSQSIQALQQQVKHPVNLFIKIDTGYGRTGVPVKKIDHIKDLIAQTEKTEHLNFQGFLSHYGHSYSCRDVASIQQLYQENTARLLSLKNQLQATYPNITLSVGDTPCCSRVDEFGAIDEMRPGNFVFFDYTQFLISSCAIEEIAVAMSCPIVALHPERGEVIVHGGSVHFSTDRIVDSSGQLIFGWVVENEGEAWGAPIPEAYVKKLSQEHGTIHGPRDWVETLKIGDCLKILPIHSCLTANSMRKYYNVNDGNWIKMMI